MLIESIHNMLLFTIVLVNLLLITVHILYMKTGISSEQCVYHENELEGWIMNANSVLT